jgi:hypothetical protein
VDIGKHSFRSRLRARASAVGWGSRVVSSVGIGYTGRHGTNLYESKHFFGWLLHGTRQPNALDHVVYYGASENQCLMR